MRFKWNVESEEKKIFLGAILVVRIYIGVQKGYRNRSEIPSILFTHKTRSMFTHFALDIDVVR